MKTPKRYQNKLISTIPEDSEPDRDELNIWCARAKRKNKIAQLKQVIRNCKRITHLPIYTPIWQAAALIRDLRRPGKNADLKAWNAYFRQLEEISVQIGREMRRAGIIAGERLEQQNHYKRSGVLLKKNGHIILQLLD